MSTVGVRGGTLPSSVERGEGRSHVQRSAAVAWLAVSWLVACAQGCDVADAGWMFGAAHAQPEAEEPPHLTRHGTATQIPAQLADQDSDMWMRMAPEPSRIQVRSSVDGSMQPALFYDSRSERDKPLLVVLHSWSTNYLQNVSIPFAHWAADNDWVFIHPDFRGPYNRPEATVSELVQRDILDAVEYALHHARIDARRVYLTGYSGGAMTALVMAGRYPERWSAVAAWVPIYDLVDWYGHHRARGRHGYLRDIASSCGGPPHPGTAAEAECRRRSPSTHLQGAKDRVPVLLAVGVNDALAPPIHAIRAYNVLVDEPARLSPREVQQLARQAAQRGTTFLNPGDDDWLALFEQSSSRSLLSRRSNHATLVLFEGGHDVHYNPGLVWLSRQRRPTGVPPASNSPR